MPPLKKRTAPRVTREPERTRARILEAAFDEFAAKGFAGARVSEIARRADSNKRMLYHYFTDKDGLFRAVMRQKIAARQALADQASNTASDLPRWFTANCQDAGWIRLLGWESLQADGHKVVEEEARMAAVARSLERTRNQQANGQLDSRWDARLYLLAMASLTTFPVAYSQVTRMITSQPLSDPDFQRDYGAFLRELAATFHPGAACRK